MLHIQPVRFDNPVSSPVLYGLDRVTPVHTDSKAWPIRWSTQTGHPVGPGPVFKTTLL